MIAIEFIDGRAPEASGESRNELLQKKRASVGDHIGDCGMSNASSVAFFSEVGSARPFSTGAVSASSLLGGE